MLLAIDVARRLRWRIFLSSHVSSRPATTTTRSAVTRTASPRLAGQTNSIRHRHGRHNRSRQGSEVTNCYVNVHDSGNVGRIASGIPPFLSHFCVEGMVLGTKNVVH